MSYLVSRWLSAPATALRAGLVLGLAVSTLAACGDSAPSVTQNVILETAEDTPLEVRLPASGNGALTFSIVDAPDHVTAGRLYWADWLAQAIQSAHLADGGGFQNVNSGSSRSLGLAWMPAP